VHCNRGWRAGAVVGVGRHHWIPHRGPGPVLRPDPDRWGIPPWGFRTGAPITGASGSYARGHGDINLAANTVSGILCQANRWRGRDSLIIMTVKRHLGYHSHYANMWGYPGNIMKITVRVKSSDDSRCAVGTIGHVTLFASYNGVRSDSVQFFFPKACSDHRHLYHGSQVNNQVPPL
jgi:hypothetical protein